MDLIVRADGTAISGEQAFRCALGRGGIKADKREGDGATPVGQFPVRRLLYRGDRGPRPATRLSIAPLSRRDGWCDDVADSQYNRQVVLPYPARHERLWRDDEIYDLILVIGHNDDPVRPGDGSAVFVHIARSDYAPTEGCVALARADLLAVIAGMVTGDVVRIEAPP